MRKSHSILSCSLALFAGMSALPGIAGQAVPASPAVLDPAAPSAALQHSDLPTSGTIVAQPGDWKAANAAVARFPRGHADVLKWEKAQAPATGKTTPPAAPAHDSAHHSGAKP